MNLKRIVLTRREGLTPQQERDDITQKMGVLKIDCYQVKIEPGYFVITPCNHITEEETEEVIHEVI